MKDEARYLGFLITITGLIKAAETEFEGKNVAACAAKITQPFFDAEFPSAPSAHCIVRK